MVVEVPKGTMMASENPLAHLQVRFKELENGFRVWLSKQSLPVEAAVVAATSAVQGAAIGAFMGTLTNDASSAFSTTATPSQTSLNPQAMAPLKQAQVLLSILEFYLLSICCQILVLFIISEGCCRKKMYNLEGMCEKVSSECWTSKKQHEHELNLAKMCMDIS